MKKITIAFVCISFLASCSIFHKEKYGCPGSPGDDWKKSQTTDQKIANGEDVKQPKFKVKNIN
jgi:hypothetical protein